MTQAFQDYVAVVKSFLSSHQRPKSAAAAIKTSEPVTAQGKGVVMCRKPCECHSR